MTKMILAIALGLSCIGPAHADTYVVDATETVLIAQADTAPADAGVAAPDTTQPAAPAATSSPTTAPADKLHDPIASPQAAWDDVKAAKKIGWAVLAFALLTMLARLAGRLGKNIKLLSPLAKGKTAVVVGAVGALAAACYNAAASEGAWTAVLLSGVVAIGHYLDASKTE